MSSKVKIGFTASADRRRFGRLGQLRQEVIEEAPVPAEAPALSLNEQADLLKPRRLSLTVCEVTPFLPGPGKCFSLRSADGGPLPLFKAGQFISCTLRDEEGTVSRPFCLVSSPFEAHKGIYRIAVFPKEESPAARRFLKNLRMGDSLEASVPMGSFSYEPLRDSRQLVGLAEGRGVTPFLSMARALRDGTESYSLTLLVQADFLENVPFRNVFEELASACSRFSFIPVLGTEAPEGYASGSLNQAVIRRYAPMDASYFLSGSAAFIGSMEAELAPMEPAAHLIRRQYTGTPRELKGRPGYPDFLGELGFSLKVKRGDEVRELRAQADEPLLLALERAGLTAQAPCRSGICGLCRSRLISGAYFVPAENDGRLRSDLTLGYIHPCATYPLTDMEIEIPLGE